MHELVVVNKEQKAVTTSLKVAEYFDKNHYDVLKAIKNFDYSQRFNDGNFAVINYVDSRGRTKPAVEMTRDGFMFLVMGFTGKEAARIKEAFIEAFNMLEDKVRALTLEERKQITDLLRANSAMLIEQDNTIKELAPKAEVHDRTMDLGDSMTMRNAARILVIKPMSFGPMLAMLGIIFKHFSYGGVFQQTSVWLGGKRIPKTSMGGPIKRATHFRG